jgi:lipopolysaccharide/colanic/teichoic acid biosynthesis glycosyltransferase
MDVLFSHAALALLVLLTCFVALAVRLDSSGPALFRQERIGRGRRPFRLWKLRTMTETRMSPTATALSSGISSFRSARGTEAAWHWATRAVSRPSWLTPTARALLPIST